MDNITVVGLKIDNNNHLIRDKGRILCTVLNEDGSQSDAFINESHLQQLMPKENIADDNVVTVDEKEDFSEEDDAEEICPQSLDGAPESGRKWSSDNVKALIISYEEIWENPNNKKKLPKALWEMVKNKVNEMEHCNYTSKDCSEKMKSLRKTFKNQKKKRETSGNGNTSNWEHYELMNNFMFKKPEITPVATSSNLSGFKKNNLKDVGKRNMDSSSDEENPSVKQRRKKKSVTDTEKVLQFLKEKEERKNKFMERFLNILEKK